MPKICQTETVEQLVNDAYERGYEAGRLNMFYMPPGPQLREYERRDAYTDGFKAAVVALFEHDYLRPMRKDLKPLRRALSEFINRELLTGWTARIQRNDWADRLNDPPPEPVISVDQD